MKALLSIIKPSLAGLGNLFLSVDDVKNSVTEELENSHQHIHSLKGYSEEDMDSSMSFSEISRDDIFLKSKIFPGIM